MWYCFHISSVKFRHLRNYPRLYIRYAQPTLWLNCGFRLLICNIEHSKLFRFSVTNINWFIFLFLPHSKLLSVPSGASNIPQRWENDNHHSQSFFQNICNFFAVRCCLWPSMYSLRRSCTCLLEPWFLNEPIFSLLSVLTKIQIFPFALRKESGQKNQWCGNLQEITGWIVWLD